MMSNIASAELFFSQDSNANGLYSINTTTGQATNLGTTDVNGSNVGLAPGDTSGTLLGTQPFGLLRIQQDGSGSAMTGIIAAEGLAYDPTSGTLFGSISGNFFSSLNFVTTIPLASPGADVEGLAYDRNRNVVYGLAGFDGPMGQLQEYDVANDTWTVIGNTGVLFDLPGLAFDPVNNILYAIGDQDDNLYMIDPTNAFTTAIGPTGLQSMGSLTSGGGLAFVVPVEPTVVVPDSFSVTRGDYVAGGLPELAESDNMDLSLRRRVSDIQSRTEFEVKGTSPTASPMTFEFTLEGAVFARSNVVQTIELFDYNTAAWELVDSSNAVRSPSPDSVVIATPTGDLSRFVEAGTMCIEARVRFLSDSPRQRFASNTDQAVWMIQ